MRLKAPPWALAARALAARALAAPALAAAGLLGAALASGFAGGSAMRTAVADAGLAERGRIIADTYCSECHATGSTGASPMPEAPALRTFQERWPVEHLAEALAEGIMVGHEDMPEFRMTTSEIDAFLAYLDSF